MWSPSTCSTAKHTLRACTLSGCASSGALGSPVSRFDSNPVTYSVPVSGRSSPVSVASTTNAAWTVTAAPAPSAVTGVSVTEVTRSPSVVAAVGRTRSSRRTRPADRHGASISSSTPTATRGSWHSLETQPAPGLRASTCARRR